MKNLLRIFCDKSALLLITVGALLYTVSVPLPADTWVNLPLLETALQLCGGMFLLFGCNIIASRIFWPGISVRSLMQLVEQGNTAAGMVLLGLKVFNGLSLIGFALFMALSFGARLGAK